MEDDYYKILNVSADASPDEIKKAYRKLAIKWHPDKNKGDTDAEEHFKKISQAYDILSDVNKRNQYDMFGSTTESNTSHASGFNPFDMFDSFFGNGDSNFESIFKHDSKRNNTPNSGSNLKIKIEVNIDEIIKDVNKTISFNRSGKCNPCNGSGKTKNSSFIRCSDCGGSGVFYRRMGPMQLREMCMTCGGHGQLTKNPCGTCSGLGISQESITTKIKIPRGCYSGITLKIPDMGNYSPGGRYGYLYVEIYVKSNTRYDREGNDLYVTEYIPFYDAMLGTSHKVNSLYGVINVSIPPMSKLNTMLKVKRHGLPDMKNNEHLGDMYVRVLPSFPDKLTKEQSAILELFKKTK
jgi:molecular chaperone DnaJ